MDAQEAGDQLSWILIFRFLRGHHYAAAAAADKSVNWLSFYIWCKS